MLATVFFGLRCVLVICETVNSRSNHCSLFVCLGLVFVWFWIMTVVVVIVGFGDELLLITYEFYECYEFYDEL